MNRFSVNNCQNLPTQVFLAELIDTHCHLDCESLSAQLPFLLSAARKAGVTNFVVPGVHPAGWERITRLFLTESGINPAYGIHPMHADLANDDNLSLLSEIANQGIAIGEIGLDPNYSVSPVVQEAAFRNQLQIAVKAGLPVLVHCRNQFQRTLQILHEEQAVQVGGIMHAFSGSPEMAREFIRLGFVISLSGTVTWHNAVRPVRLAVELPLDRLVLETDSPDMAPHPFRGEPNQPAWLLYILYSVAEKRGITPAEVASTVLVNTRRVLRKLWPS